MWLMVINGDYTMVINVVNGDYSHRQNYGKKNVLIYRRRLSMIEKLRTFFFP